MLVDPGPESCRETLLAALGGDAPRAILLTHIHLDHAGASGALVRAGPTSRCGSTSAARRTCSTRRGCWPAPRACTATTWTACGARSSRCRRPTCASCAAARRSARARVAYTPGHASHHVSYLHEPTGTAFVGDVGGRAHRRRAGVPPTPPPDIDIEAWHASLDTLAAWDPQRLAITHFGAYDDVAAQLRAMHEALDRWGALAREIDDDSYRATLVSEMRGADSELMDSFLLAMPPDMQWAGLKRYWSKRAA